MLGVPYDCGIDIWSIGATVFELSSGRILFAGKSNNQMLRQMIDVCGGFCRKLVLEGEFSKKHFNADGLFLYKDPDSMTGEPIATPAWLERPLRPVAGLLQAALTTPAAGIEKATHD